MGDALYLELCRLAEEDNRSFSEYCELWLARHAFGHSRRGPDITEGSSRD